MLLLEHVTVWRRRVGTIVLAQDVLAQRRLGAGRFGAAWISAYIGLIIQSTLRNIQFRFLLT